MAKLIPVVAFALLISPGAVAEQSAPPPPEEEAIHDALRVLRDNVMKAINSKDVEASLQYLHPEVVFTAMNAEVARGHDEVRAYYERMMSGPNRIVEDVTYDLTVDTLSILHGGDTAVAYGSSDDHYRLADGAAFDVTTRWSATLVLEDGRWLIASFQHGASPFDNPVLGAVKSSLLRIGLVAALGGLIAGVLVGRVTKRSRA